jgi:hypothetical protein
MTPPQTPQTVNLHLSAESAGATRCLGGQMEAHGSGRGRA